MSDPLERELARWKGGDLEVEDHGCLTLTGCFEYESGGQGLGYFVDASFLMRFMAALGVTQLSGCDGKSCWVTHSNSEVVKIEPLHKDDGQPFDIREWREWIKGWPRPSAYEMRTGRKP